MSPAFLNLTDPNDDGRVMLRADLVAAVYEIPSRPARAAVFPGEVGHDERPARTRVVLETGTGYTVAEAYDHVVGLLDTVMSYDPGYDALRPTATGALQ